jgi:hypothetical protein
MVSLPTNMEKEWKKSSDLSLMLGFSLENVDFMKSYVLLRRGCEIELSETIV